MYCIETIDLVHKFSENEIALKNNVSLQVVENTVYGSLVPIGAGFAIWFLGVGMLAWEYSYVLPYNHGTIDYLIGSAQFANRSIPPINIQFLAVIYFVVITVASYILYAAKNEKG
jgi:hypothetical protein